MQTLKVRTTAQKSVFGSEHMHKGQVQRGQIQYTWYCESNRLKRHQHFLCRPVNTRHWIRFGCIRSPPITVPIRTQITTLDVPAWLCCVSHHERAESWLQHRIRTSMRARPCCQRRCRPLSADDVEPLRSLGRGEAIHKLLSPRDACDLLGIEKLNTTAYHLQYNGLTGGFNRMLKTKMRKHTARYGAPWDSYHWPN